MYTLFTPYLLLSGTVSYFTLNVEKSLQMFIMIIIFYIKKLVSAEVCKTFKSHCILTVHQLILRHPRILNVFCVFSQWAGCVTNSTSYSIILFPGDEAMQKKRMMNERVAYPVPGAFPACPGEGKGGHPLCLRNLISFNTDKCLLNYSPYRSFLKLRFGVLNICLECEFC